MLVQKGFSVVCLVLGITTALVSCGDDPAPLPADPLLSMPATHVAVVCQKALSCCSGKEQSGVLALDPPPATLSECEARLGALLEASFDQQRRAVDAGRLVFHTERADACYASVSALSCTGFFEKDFLGTNADCLGMFEGQVASGGDCGADEECRGATSLCDLSAGQTLGKCAILPGKGEPCVDGRCGAALFCRLGMGGSGLVCASLSALGEACSLDLDCTSGYCQAPAYLCADPAPDGAACSANVGCVSGYCDVASGQCSAKKPDGVNCLTNPECASGYCDDITAAGVCSAKKNAGAPCTVAGECVGGVCEQNVCATLPSGIVCDGV